MCQCFLLFKVVFPSFLHLLKASEKLELKVKVLYQIPMSNILQYLALREHICRQKSSVNHLAGVLLSPVKVQLPVFL